MQKLAAWTAAFLVSFAVAGCEDIIDVIDPGIGTFSATISGDISTTLDGQAVFVGFPSF